ncbi:hypothetical protein TIFTF001_029525 [Ficus carica]|uniref:Uncharacterized protein n=1 Tax=Ficus carica TaxID=3494 RepID=A0AA88DRR5_FICCA|nr:hypothetical protein TIFTF001_029525 [Ficus carica]
MIQVFKNDQIKIKFSRIKSSKFPCVVPTYHKSEFGPWFELDWTGCLNHSMATHHGANLQVMLSSRHLVGEARAWLLNIGNTKVPKNTWTNFRALITLRFGPLPGWRAYPNKSMGHYCQRFRDAMLPYIP